MSRITGKNAAVYSVATRTLLAVATAMTDAGAHTVYSLVISAATKRFWNPNVIPAVTKQVHGTGSFNAVSAALYTVDYINGTITFLSANNSDDVVKITNVEYFTLQSIGNMFDWALDLKLGTVDATAFQDTFATKLSQIRGWSATASGYHVSSFWWDTFIGVAPADDTTAVNPEVYVAFYPDVAGSEYWIGAGTIDYALEVKKDAPVSEKMTINGTGAIARLTS